MVIDSIFSRITRDILLLDDMAAEETLEVQTFSLSHYIVNILMLVGSYLTCIMSLASKTDSFDAGKPIFFIGVSRCSPNREVTRGLYTLSQ